MCTTGVPFRMATPLERCMRVSALYRRSDRLLVDGDPRAECLWTGNFVDAPWTAALSQRTRLVVLNRGAHYENDSLALEAWATALRAVRRAAPNALVVVRTTPAGHYNCIAHNRPLSTPLPRWRGQDYFRWLLFHVSDMPQIAFVAQIVIIPREGLLTSCRMGPLMQRQNVLLRELVDTEFPGVLLLDVEALSALRPDAHRGSGDCLHWANRLPHWRRMEELTEAPTILLFNAIKWLRKWAESLTGSKNAPLNAGNLDIA